MRRRIKLTENDLRNIVNRSVKRIIKEGGIKGLPYKHFPENSYQKANKIACALADLEHDIKKIKGLYNDAYPNEFNRRIQDVYHFACDTLELMDKYGLSNYGFDSGEYYVD